MLPMLTTRSRSSSNQSESTPPSLASGKTLVDDTSSLSSTEKAETKAFTVSAGPSETGSILRTAMGNAVDRLAFGRDRPDITRATWRPTMQGHWPTMLSRVTNGTVTALAQAMAQVPAALAAPGPTLAGLAVFVGMNSVAPLVNGGFGSRGHAEAVRQSFASNKLLPEKLQKLVPYLPLMLRTAANVLYAPAMESAALGVHLTAQLGLAASNLPADGFGHNLVEQGAWIAAEAARMGVAYSLQNGPYRARLTVPVAQQRELSAQRVASSSACNSLGANCNLLLGQIAFPGTHLSFSDQAKFFFNNQVVSVEQQFADGIRFFTVEYFVNDQGALRNSHNTMFDLGSMEDGFRRIASLLEQNPKEVIALKLSNQQKRPKPSALLAQAIRNSGLARYLPVQESPIGGLVFSGTSARNTLAQSITTGKRLWLINEDRYLESNFEATLPSQMLLSQGKEELQFADLTLLNAFTTYPFVLTSQPTNAYLPEYWKKNAVLLGAANQVVNMVAVNDYQSSPVIALAREQNMALSIGDRHRVSISR